LRDSHYYSNRMSFKRWRRGYAVLVSALLGVAGSTVSYGQTAVPVKAEFIADPAPTPSSHASTLCEARDGTLLAAWFGGTAERQRDVVIWYSRSENDQWTRPIVLARGDEDGDEQWACWNPVLTQTKKGPLVLFYKVGPNPQSWWGRLRTSIDGGKTWSKSYRIPKGFIGPVRNKPVTLSNGELLCGASEEDAGWRVHMETVNWLDAAVPLWGRTPDLNSAMDFGAIQPTILPWRDGRVQILCRTRQKVITESWSKDNGHTWSPMVRTKLPNPNSAIDAVMLRDGRAVLIHNPSSTDRSSLIASVSDDGVTWTPAVKLEEESGAEFSYPAVVQTQDGLIHVSYTWKREKIRHAVIDPAQLR